MGEKIVFNITPYFIRKHGYKNETKGYMIYIGRAMAEKLGIKEKLETSTYTLTIKYDENGKLVIEVKEN